MNIWKLNLISCLTVLIILTISSCKKPDLPENTPTCISKKIKKEKDNNCLETVYSYDYKGQSVYFFVYPCPEGCYSLVDSDCKSMQDNNGNSICYCNWGGAFCNDDFWNNKTNEKLIWEID